MIHLTSTLLILGSLMGLLLPISCTSDVPQQATGLTTSSQKEAPFELKAGDLLFQDIDCGPFCESIETVTSGIDGAEFSHVGLVVPNQQKDLVVIEAVSAGVVETPLDSFFMRSFDANNNSKVVVGRMKAAHAHLIPKAINFAKTKLGVAYDAVFDIANEQYYCSELIYYAFKEANNDQPIFQLQPMTYKDPATQCIFPIWETYFNDLNVPIPEGEAGLNPGGMSTSPYIDLVHFYGKPQGYTGVGHLSD